MHASIGAMRGGRAWLRASLLACRYAGYALDKKHTFAVTMFDDFEKYLKVPEQYAAPDKAAFQAAESVHSWMVDKLGRDQFVIRSGDQTEVFWNDGKRGRADLVGAPPWGEDELH